MGTSSYSKYFNRQNRPTLSHILDINKLFFLFQSPYSPSNGVEPPRLYPTSPALDHYFEVCGITILFKTLI
jgi:hypothetical protein